MTGRMIRVRQDPLPFARPSIGNEEIAAVTDVLRSGWLTTGPRTALFEQEFAAAVNAPAALALSSGTAALHLALLGMGVSRDDVVLTTPITFCSTVHVIEHLGARPVLVDVEPDSLNIDTVKLEAAVDSAAGTAKVVLPVHLAGRPVDMAEVLRIAGKVGAGVVEDAAHAQGAAYGGRAIGDVTAGNVDRAVCFSFYATKNITTGEGGMLTGSSEFVEEARRWSLHGMSRDSWARYGAAGKWRYEVDRPGYKYNLTDVQSALGIVQLQRSETLLGRRRDIAAAYDAAFADVDALVRPKPLAGHAWHLYVIKLDPRRTSVSRTAFVAALAERGIGTSVHFIPIHHLAYYRQKYGYLPGDFPVAAEAFEQIVSLPIYPAMSDHDVADVIDAVRDVIVRD